MDTYVIKIEIEIIYIIVMYYIIGYVRKVEKIVPDE